MDMLNERIVKDGVCIGTEIVKVDSFLNHQIDVELLDKLGKKFSEIFSDVQVDKILTVEASGIAVACMTARHFGNSPVVFAKKTVPSTMNDDFFCSEVRSFTKGTVSMVAVSKKYLNKGENILIIDDFLAHGEAASGMADLLKQAGCKVAGIGAVIGKRFQGGEKRLKEAGYNVKLLSNIEKIIDGKITFVL